MKKNIILLLACASSLHAELTVKEFVHSCTELTPKKRSLMLKPEVLIGIAAVGWLTENSKCVLQKHHPELFPRSFTIMGTFLWILLGSSITGIGVYKWIGDEMATIVRFRKILENLTKNIQKWELLIQELQKNQTAQEEKIQKGQEKLEKMLVLMQKISQQGTNEKLLTSAMHNIIDESKDVQTRIKKLEAILKDIILLQSQDHVNTSEAQQAFKEKIALLTQESEKTFGKPEKPKPSHWWQSHKPSTKELYARNTHQPQAIF